MTVTVTDTRTTFNDADSATGWNSGAAGATVFAEAPNSIIGTLNIATGQQYYTAAGTVDLSDELIYVWSNNFALQGAWDAAAPPNALHLGDGTDRVSFFMAGNNRKVFAHLDAGTGIQVDWDCLVLDGSQAATMDTAGLTIARAGAFATLTLTAITQIGSDFTTLSKGLGGGVNVATDIIRHGNDGLRITAGTTGARGTFAEIVVEDQSSATGKAHGIIRELSTGLYSLQGPLNFGIAGTATDCFFEDSGRVISFENRNISDDKYYIAVTGNSGATNLFSLTNSTITTAGPLVRLDFNGGNVNTLLLDSNSFSGLGNPITFSNLADATGHDVTNNSFTSCGQIDPGDVTFTGNTIADTTDALGGLLIDADGTANISDISFVSDGTGHAVYVTATGSYTFNNFTYTGYAVIDGSTGNESLYNNSGGLVTVTRTGGDVPTVRNGAGASTVIVSGVTLSLTGIETDSEVRIINLDDVENFNKELTGSEQISGVVTKVVVADQGTGYAVNDILTVVGGTFATAATITVDTIGGGGEVLTVSITNPGSYTANPPTPATTTVAPAGGTGATLRLTISGTFDYAYDATFTPNVAIIVFHLNFKEVRIEQNLAAVDSSIPIQQGIDRTYNNP